MNRQLKILHLEDTPTDAELIARELKTGKIDSSILLVDNKADFILALKDFSPDIILSDHSLPSFNSNEALLLLKESGIAVPFILVTATMSDEFAVSIMKQGASDYVLKDRLGRLPSAIINAVTKHRMEMEQQAVHERLKFHIENTPLGFIEWDKKGVVKSWSERAAQIFGWTEDEVVTGNKSIFQIVSDADLAVANKTMKELLSGAVIRNTVQHRNKTKSGEVIWCEWFHSILKDEGGNVITIMSLVQDITERKNIEVKLAASEAGLREAQSIALLGNWEIDLQQNKQVWSDEMFDILGLDIKENEASSELFLSVVHPDDFAETKERISRAFAGVENSSFEFRLMWKNSEVRYGYSKWKFDFDGNSLPVRISGIIQDITEPKLAEIERVKMMNELMLRNKHLEQFAYIVSHNLRAHVANIIGANSVLDIDGLSASKMKLVKSGINDSVKKLDEVIKDLNHILQVNQAIAETKESVSFSGLVEDIKILLAHLIEKDDIVIKYDFSSMEELVTIRSYLYSIFYNLICNSIKYRQPHVPCIIDIKSCRVNKKLELLFRDNGMGIDLQKRQAHVFGLYKRFHTNIDGKGMGLFMVKSQVEGLGGKISIQSEVNKGTEFKIEFGL